MDFRELSKLAYDLRKDTVDMIVAGKGGHIGGDMSVMETLVTLYFDQMNISPENMNDPDRDLFVMSKGHSVEAYYAVLAKKGFLDIKEVNEKFSKFGTQYIGHPNNKLPGIEMNSGSLGHGLPVCVGMALAGKMNKKDYRVYTVMGDGELAEGSVWEAAMAGHQYKLDNLCAIVDRNRLQISGNTAITLKEGDYYGNIFYEYSSGGYGLSVDIMEDILQFIENLDCEEINELNEEGLLNNNIALQADINGKDIHFELRNDAGEKLEKTIPEDELQKYIVGYEMIRCDGRGMKKERRKCGSCENFTPIEGCAKGNCSVRGDIIQRSRIICSHDYVLKADKVLC